MEHSQAPLGTTMERATTDKGSPGTVAITEEEQAHYILTKHGMPGLVSIAYAETCGAADIASAPNAKDILRSTQRSKPLHGDWFRLRSRRNSRRRSERDAWTANQVERDNE